jgi:hypothetical protein
MADINIHIDLCLTRKTILAGATLMLLAVCAGDLASESVTLTTYYPAPSGDYAQMLTTGQATLARDTGRVDVGTNLESAGQPTVKLHVNGPLRVESTCAPTPFAGLGNTNCPAGTYVTMMTGIYVDNQSYFTAGTGASNGTMYCCNK